MIAAPLGWLGILRLGFVQAALGAVVVLTTSTMNRIMVVELALPAMLPGFLVGLHYALQVLRPRLGYGSDGGGRRTRWIIGGMAGLALGAVMAAAATAWMAESPQAGVALAVLAFTLIGGGVGSAGTSLLALAATAVSEDKRAAAAMIMWMMMIGGIVVTALAAGHFLDPYSPQRLVIVAAVVAGAAFSIATLAVWGIERTAPGAARLQPKPPFMIALRRVWADDEARLFTVFVFVSMLAYSAQDLVLEPFAGAVFGLTPGQSTQLAGVQHGGVLLGMLLVGVLASGHRSGARGSLRNWTIAGCVASALALAMLSAGAFAGPQWPLRASVFGLGIANGVFAVAAIGSMMVLACKGEEGREGTRIGLWGAAQAIAFGLGGFLGTATLDLARTQFDDDAAAYAFVFAAEGVVFLVAASLAKRIGTGSRSIQQSESMDVAVLRSARG